MNCTYALKRKGWIHNQNTIIEWERFWMLTVLKQVHHRMVSRKKSLNVNVIAETVRSILLYMLLNGARTHCGCMNRKVSTTLENFYSRFNNMNDRCGNPKSKAWRNYGARWIKVEWENVRDFYRDILPTYKGLHLDRIDAYWNYSKENFIVG